MRSLAAAQDTCAAGARALSSALRSFRSTRAPHALDLQARLRPVRAGASCRVGRWPTWSGGGARGGGRLGKRGDELVVELVHRGAQRVAVGELARLADLTEQAGVPRLDELVELGLEPTDLVDRQVVQHSG